MNRLDKPAWLTMVLLLCALRGEAQNPVSSDQASDGAAYIVVLRTTAAPGSPPAAPPTLPDAAIAALGGTVKARSFDRVVVTLPAAAVDGLRRHPAVRYIQDTVVGEQPVVQPKEGTADGKLRAETTALRTEVQWNSGTYLYDGAGNVISIGPTRSFDYDPLSRLTASHLNGRPESYTYDAFGNMKERITDNVSWPIAFSSTTNRLTGAGYDVGGNVINYGGAEFAYDPFNMVRERHENSSQDLYIYTASDERIGVRDGATWVWSLRDESGRVLRQYDADMWNMAAEWRWVEDYVYRDRQLMGAERVPEEGGRRIFHLDHLGTPRLITGVGGLIVSQHEYFPFGNELTALLQETAAGFDREEPRKFTAHERDFHGSPTTENTNYLDYMHARYYHPGLARFLSVDPTWESADLGAPQSWNRYSYVRNNPINNTDPDGRICIPCAAVGGLIGGVYESYRQVRSGEPVNNVRLLGAIGIGATAGAAVGAAAPIAYNAVLANPAAVATGTTIAGGALTPGPESLTSAVPNAVRLLTPGAGGRMLTEAIGVVSESPAAQRVGMMDEMLKQISARADAPWVAQKVSAGGGATAWVGDAHTLVIDASGNIYKGPNSVVKFGTKDGDLLVKDWSQLKQH